MAQLTEEELAFDDGFERRELYSTFAAACEAHVENLRVQVRPSHQTETVTPNRNRHTKPKPPHQTETATSNRNRHAKPKSSRQTETATPNRQR